jgi:hypothetical protein
MPKPLDPEAVFWPMLAIAVAVLVVAGILAHRTFRVTRRRHTFALIAVWLSRATVAGALISVVLFAAGVTFDR